MFLQIPQNRVISATQTKPRNGANPGDCGRGKRENQTGNGPNELSARDLHDLGPK